MELDQNENGSDEDCQIISALSAPLPYTKGIHKTKSLEVKKRKQKKEKIDPE